LEESLATKGRCLLDLNLLFIFEERAKIHPEGKRFRINNYLPSFIVKVRDFPF
jgi:hypothetical protein